MSPVLMLPAGVGIGGTVGLFAMSTVNRQKAEETPKDDEE